MTGSPNDQCERATELQNNLLAREGIEVSSPTSDSALTKRARRKKRSRWTRRLQLAIGCLAIGLPVAIALILDQTNFLGSMHRVWWIAFACATAACFLFLPWSERGYPKLLLTGGIFGVVNAVLFLSTPSPGKSIYWECADMISGLFVSHPEVAPVVPLTDTRPLIPL